MIDAVSNNNQYNTYRLGSGPLSIITMYFFAEIGPILYLYLSEIAKVRAISL